MSSFIEFHVFVNEIEVFSSSDVSEVEKLDDRLRRAGAASKVKAEIRSEDGLVVEAAMNVEFVAAKLSEMP